MDNEFVYAVLRKSVNTISMYLGLECKDHENILHNAIIRTESRGFNSVIYIVDFFDCTGRILGNVCIKTSLNENMRSNLITEANILKLLYAHGDFCPKVLEINILDHRNTERTYIIMETVKKSRITSVRVSAIEARAISKLIKFHESLLLENIQKLNSPEVASKLHQKIDFQEKIHKLLFERVPKFKLTDSLSFLNRYLNSDRVMKRRTIITDRSAENILKNNKENFVLIDFSTIRVGTQFDNWIQFIDDPRIDFTLSKENLTNIFYEGSELSKDEESFYVATIYTNLLQGIFTYEKDPDLSASYFRNTNKAFEKLENKKNMLISVSY